MSRGGFRRFGLLTFRSYVIGHVDFLSYVYSTQQFLSLSTSVFALLIHFPFQLINLSNFEHFILIIRHIVPMSFRPSKCSFSVNSTFVLLCRMSFRFSVFAMLCSFELFTFRFYVHLTVDFFVLRLFDLRTYLCFRSFFCDTHDLAKYMYNNE